ncbi:MAG: IS4 family transposase, partial [Gammaproteobacteria bacterium]
MVVREQRFSFNEVRQALGAVLGEDLHAKRVDSLSGATLGVLRSASLAVCAIGQGLAAARGLKPKYAVKQVDRLLSNPKINVDDILGRWVPYVVGARTSIVVALDWTDFDADRQATIMLSLITDHGRATPLVWLTVDKRTLKDHRSLYEHRVLVRLAELLPADTKVCVVADRGFGD